MATIELLLKYGVDSRAQNKEGKTPAQWYRQLGMDEVADYMDAREAANNGSAPNPR